MAAMIATSMAAGLWLAWRPMDYLVGHNVSDDAFYYFQTAREISQGGGVSVDARVWANGFHPLWMLVLVPVYLIPGLGGDAAVHVALSISAIVTSLSAMPLYLVARKVGLSVVAALAASALYLFHPVVMMMSVNGLETGVNVAAFVYALYAFVVCAQEPTSAHRVRASLAAGVLVLSRTDYGIVAALMLAWLWLGGRSWRSTAQLATPAVLLTAPWFIWNVVVFGSPLQGSAGAVPYVAHQLFPAPGASTWESVVHGLVQMREGGYRTIPSFYFSADSRLAPVAFAFMVGVPVACLIASSMRRARGRSFHAGILCVPLLGLIGQFTVHAGVRWYLREWYFVALFPLLALFLAMLIDMLREIRLGAILGVVLVATTLAATITKGVSTYGDGWYPVQIDMLRAAQWIDANAPQGATVGAFNSGIVGYFDGRTTVNLDGVMNPQALTAIQHRRVVAYMHERNVQMLADFPYYPFGLYAPFMGDDLRVTVLAAFHEHQTFQGPFTVWSVGK